VAARRVVEAEGAGSPAARVSPRSLAGGDKVLSTVILYMKQVIMGRTLIVKISSSLGKNFGMHRGARQGC
jgi:hypothetical protein